MAEKGRALMYLGRFDEAETSLLAVINRSDVILKYQRIAYDSWCQISQRKAFKDFEKGDFEGALLECEKLLQKFLSVPPSCWDDKLLTTAARAVRQYRRLEAELARSDLLSRAADARAQLEAIAYQNPAGAIDNRPISDKEPGLDAENGGRENGIVAKIAQ
jgi:hypothetical protein